ncbi:tetratricopeptide repeat protein [Allomuricauda sp. SCSIO 65647]|uniref:tetratricopeptide repeat-containing sensor histidine kinase n=1 Tax=Allomuricauda sp. SCSIO 65647 TaxID=2908843 RepID=UPI001F338530|nr:tetratricopeptide repeat protein [Muricauda sp. SCSIO 65647]UJH68422.1 sensor histidine kinase [Muricauda sp. SCSIO 65647]
MPIKRLHIIITFLCPLMSIQVFGQTRTVDSLMAVLQETDSKEDRAKLQVRLSKALERIDIAKSKKFAKEALLFDNDSLKSEAHNQLGRASFYQNELDSASFHFTKSIDLLNDLDLQDQAASVRISLGAVQLRKGEYRNSVTTLITSAAYFENSGDSINMAKCYSNVSTAFGELGDSQKAIVYGEKALAIFTQKNMLPFKAVTLPNLAGEFLKLGDTTRAKSYFLQAEALANQRNDQFSLARIYNNLGNMYLETDHDESEKYLTKALDIRKQTKNNDGIGTLYNNLGYLQLKKGNALKAIPYLKTALQFGQGSNATTTYNNLSDAHRQLGDFKMALFYEQQKNALNDSILKVENQKAIAEISTKYETEKKEKEILNLQNANLQTDMRRRQNRNLMYGAFALLLVAIILTYAFIKNSRKKRIIAEQLQELESQKVERLLKEQELTGIDAMIEGQEKERQRIAEDLHDSLGGKLSALKLFVEDIKKSDQALYGKIKTVLDESYDDVRNISHQKNTSAMIEKGLIPAVNMVANRLKSTEKLHVEVTNIDLKQKIQNFIELQLFRIIQELLANTIKHAKAKNVNIQFSEENSTLNVLYEDDGIGFDTENVDSGVGLKNIGNRIQKIGGSLAIDSNPGAGTTIILNVPI